MGLQSLHKASTGFSHGSSQPLGPSWATGGTAVSPLGPAHHLIVTLPSLGPGHCHPSDRGISVMPGVTQEPFSAWPTVGSVPSPAQPWVCGHTAPSPSSAFSRTCTGVSRTIGKGHPLPPSTPFHVTKQQLSESSSSARTLHSTWGAPEFEKT